MKSFIRLSLALSAWVCCAAHAQHAPVINDGPIVASINSQLMLSRSWLAELDAPDAIGDGFSVSIPVDGGWVTADVHRHSTRAEGYILRVQDETGYVDETPGEVKTFRGTVREIPGAVVAGGFQGTAMEARIMLPDGGNYWIEPANKYAEDAPETVFVVYRSADQLPLPYTCGCEDHQQPIALPISNTDNGERGVGGDCGGLCVTQLACDADVEYFNNYGSVSAVEDRINLVINTMNPQYEDQTGITHEITAIIIRAAEFDPYTQTDASALLNEFTIHWNNFQTAIERDVAELFTGKDISGNVIGIAQLGVICTSNAYNVVEDFGGLSCSTDLSAHELGHNWSATHTSQTMNSSLTCANTFNGTSITQIVQHRNSRDCLSPGIVATASLPFSDSFPTATIDDLLWSRITGAEANTLASNEPSPAFSANINGSDELRSAFMDTSDRASLTVSYWVQEGGTQNPPENGEDLIVEYRNNTGAWIEFARELGAGNPETTFTFRTFDLPADAFHSTFAIQFRGVSSAESADNWYIDDVTIDGPQRVLPSPFGLLAPINGTTGIPAAPLFFDWEDSANADSYLIELAPTGAFANPVFSETVTASETTLDLSTLAPGAFYFWRVTASALDGDLTSLIFDFRMDPVDLSLSPIELRLVRSDDVGVGSPGPITLDPGQANVDLYVQARVSDDPNATGIVAFDGTLFDEDPASSFDKAPLSAEEAGIPTPGLDPLGRTGMFPSYRGVIQNDNDNEGNGFFSNDALGFLPLNISPTGNGEGINGAWSNIYKVSWSSTDQSPRTIPVTIGATSGGYQRSQADGGLAQPVAMLIGSIDITLQAGGACVCDLDGNTTVDIADLLTFLAIWFAEDGTSVPAGSGADFDSSGNVDIADLLAFLSCWFTVSDGGACPS